MIFTVLSVLADFTAPLRITTTPQSLLWLLPLTAAVTVVYKATKMQKITAAAFIKEVVVLFVSIVVVLIAVAMSLHFLNWLITE